MKRRVETILRNVFSKRGAIIAVWGVFCLFSFWILNIMIGQLREREENYIKLWASAMGRLSDLNPEDPFVRIVMTSNIPFIIMNDRRVVEYYSDLIPDIVIDTPQLLERQLNKFSKLNDYIEIRLWNGSRFWVFYGRSKRLMMLTYFPVAQTAALMLLMWLGIALLQSSKSSEQNRVWVGLAKETAHQLGTPISSILGWIEYLQTQNVDNEVIDEMRKDIAHLTKITDRFSKIGSETPLEPANVNEVVGETIMYFRKRIPKNVILNYNGLAMAPVRARINLTLFEWVIENLLKNALDALQGKGVIDVRISQDNKNVFVDVHDTGKGIPRANFKKIFEPGFTTKTRGWGLGLSLSHRVVEEYHRGRIFVVESEVGKGTTIRVALKMLHS